MSRVDASRTPPRLTERRPRPRCPPGLLFILLLLLLCWQNPGMCKKIGGLVLEAGLTKRQVECTQCEEYTPRYNLICGRSVGGEGGRGAYTTVWPVDRINRKKSLEAKKELADPLPPLPPVAFYACRKVRKKDAECFDPFIWSQQK
jgi:hypothetical protein